MKITKKNGNITVYDDLKVVRLKPYQFQLFLLLHKLTLLVLLHLHCEIQELLKYFYS